MCNCCCFGYGSFPDILQVHKVSGPCPKGENNTFIHHTRKRTHEHTHAHRRTRTHIHTHTHTHTHRRGWVHRPRAAGLRPPHSQGRAVCTHRRCWRKHHPPSSWPLHLWPGPWLFSACVGVWVWVWVVGLCFSVNASGFVKVFQVCPAREQTRC